ncbi:MAG: nitroreductase family protein [Planctomycetota bacterium]
MNGFLDLAAWRRSVRAYTNRPVEPEKILRCLEAARLAPSACNAQPWRFVVVDDPVLREQVASRAAAGIVPMNSFARQAPVLVVVVMERANFTSRFGSVVKAKSFPLVDIGIAAEHFCLQATEEGLGTCILGWFDERGVRALLEIPRRSRPILILTLGYPADGPNRPKKRKPLEEIASWNGYQASKQASSQ